MKTILDQDRLDLAKLFTGVGVEIGVAEGWYSNKIMELGKVTKMYGVDPYIPHSGYRDYTRETTFNRLQAKAHERLDKYSNYEFIRGYSLETAKKFEDNSLDWVYIDGDHSYEAVMDDITVWIAKVKPGGIIAGDDYIKSDRDKRFYDVVNAVNDYVEIHNIPELFLYKAGRTPTNWMFYK
jgi:hypothetical protein